MSARRTRRSAELVLIVLALGCWQLLPAAHARAQSAWLPLEGERALSLTFQQYEFGGHYDDFGNKLDEVLPTRSLVAIVQFEYGLTDKLAFAARLPYIASRFTGFHDETVITFLRERYEELRHTHPELEGTPVDTGAYYATFQDFHFNLRYNLLDGPVAVTPAFSMTIPSHDYRTIGDAAAGQNRRAVHTGVNVGALLEPLLPRTYFHGRYTYSFVQRLVGISLDRSNAEFEVGYGVTPRVTVRGLAEWQRTHGGITFLQALDHAELFFEHDRLLSSRHMRAGGGVTVSLTDSIDLDGAIASFLSGSNAHFGFGFSVGLTWRFEPASSVQPSRQVRLPHRGLR